MPQKTLVILSNSFPVGSGDAWLADEVKYIPKDWKAQVFCLDNKDKTQHPEYPQLELLPNTFTYKRNLSCFFNGAFLSALFAEVFTLIGKGIFWKTIASSLSVLMRAFEMAKWFTESHIKQGEEYILYSYWGNENATMACFVKTINRNVKAVCRVHGIDVYEEITHLHHIQYRRFQLTHLSKMLSVSEAGANYLKNRYSAFANKIGTSYLGTEQTILNPMPYKERLELVSCAKVRNVKRLYLVAEILKELQIPVRWTLAGDGPDLEALKTQCKSLPPNVTTYMPGYLDKKGLKQLFETNPFHYYISTSSTEGIPVAMMESIGYGVPIISTDVGGCREVVTNETGILIPTDFDPKEVAALITNLFDQYDYSMEKRKRVQQEWDRKFNSAKNYMEFYKQINS